MAEPYRVITRLARLPEARARRVSLLNQAQRGEQAEAVALAAQRLQQAQASGPTASLTGHVLISPRVMERNRVWVN